MVATAQVTSGLTPLTVSSIELFVLQADLDGLPWNFVGGTVNLLFTDPNGNNSSVSATIGADGVPRASWTVPNVVGNWTRAWQCLDSLGVFQVSRPITFNVVSSPS